MFAVGIHADSVAGHTDWRSDHDALRYYLVDLPDHVRDGVSAFMVELHLAYSAFDFVITPEGDWVMLETNPGGQYGWLEAHTRVPLADTMADLLAAGRAS